MSPNCCVYIRPMLGKGSTGSKIGVIRNQSDRIGEKDWFRINPIRRVNQDHDQREPGAIRQRGAAWGSWWEPERIIHTYLGSRYPICLSPAPPPSPPPQSYPLITFPILRNECVGACRAAHARLRVSCDLATIGSNIPLHPFSYNLQFVVCENRI